MPQQHLGKDEEFPSLSRPSGTLSHALVAGRGNAFHSFYPDFPWEKVVEDRMREKKLKD